MPCDPFNAVVESLDDVKVRQQTLFFNTKSRLTRDKFSTYLSSSTSSIVELLHFRNGLIEEMIFETDSTIITA
jgi:hypothetical protein